MNEQNPLEEMREERRKLFAYQVKRSPSPLVKGGLVHIRVTTTGEHWESMRLTPEEADAVAHAILDLLDDWETTT